MITTIYHSPLGDIALAATARGLAGAWFCDDLDARRADVGDSRAFDMARGEFLEGKPDGIIEEVEGCDAISGARQMSASHPANSSAVSVLERAWAWLNAYFAGQAPRWAPPMDLSGDDFEHAVWVVLLGLDYGETSTCAAMADLVGARIARGADASRVRSAVEACPVKILIPCHRVTDAQRPDLPGADTAAALRRLEAIG